MKRRIDLLPFFFLTSCFGGALLSAMLMTPYINGTEVFAPGGIGVTWPFVGASIDFLVGLLVCCGTLALLYLIIRYTPESKYVESEKDGPERVK